MIEFTRQPDEHIGFLLFDLSVGQLISIVFLLTGIFLWWNRKNVY